MPLSTFTPPPISPFPITNPNPNQTLVKLPNLHARSSSLKFNNSNFIKRYNYIININTNVGTTPTATSGLLANRINRLVSEFASLVEPVDRVKRLLDYAARLPPYTESSIRLPSNRVMGCTTQVWIEARLDEKGRMRFRGDSDSEITKGFISCLIWLLDGLEPHDAVSVKADDLAAMNVGIYGTAQSRINTWNNILISMQNRTKDLVAQSNSCVAKSRVCNIF